MARSTRKPKTRATTRKKKGRTPKKRHLNAKQVDRALHGNAAEKQAALTNRKLHWNVYKMLQKEVERAWVHFKNNIQKRASPTEISRSKNHLLLLLGECDYMAREYQRQALNLRRT